MTAELEKIVRDAIWAVSSPDLLSDDVKVAKLPPEITSELLGWLHTDQAQRAIGKDVSEQKTKRLGVYFEQLWLSLLKHYPGFELIAYNHPVTQAGRTLGAFDFIYFCHRRRAYFHLETAVKFYLYSRLPELPANAEQNWIGPGCKDRLDLKLNKMLDHQCQLSRTEAGMAAAKALGVKSLTPEICLKGYLFYPWPCDSECPTNNEIQPAAANKTHLRGYWLGWSRIASLSGTGPWYVLNKAQWLSGPNEADINSRADTLKQLRATILSYFDVAEFPLLVASLKQNRAEQTETLRVFVTPDNWPGKIA